MTVTLVIDIFTTLPKDPWGKHLLIQNMEHIYLQRFICNGMEYHITYSKKLFKIIKILENPQFFESKRD